MDSLNIERDEANRKAEFLLHAYTIITHGLRQSLTTAETKRAGPQTPPFTWIRLLFGSDDDVRIQRRRGIYFLRQLQERTNVIPPILAPAFHQCPDRLPRLAVVIVTINSVDLHSQPSLSWSSTSSSSKNHWASVGENCHRTEIL